MKPNRCGLQLTCYHAFDDDRKQLEIPCDTPSGGSGIVRHAWTERDLKRSAGISRQRGFRVSPRRHDDWHRTNTDTPRMSPLFGNADNVHYVKLIRRYRSEEPCGHRRPCPISVDAGLRLDRCGSAFRKHCVARMLAPDPPSGQVRHNWQHVTLCNHMSTESTHGGKLQFATKSGSRQDAHPVPGGRLQFRGVRPRTDARRPRDRGTPLRVLAVPPASRHERILWRTRFYRAFPGQGRRHAVYAKLAGLHQLRNRIAHHEPIHRGMSFPAGC